MNLVAINQQVGDLAIRRIAVDHDPKCVDIRGDGAVVLNVVNDIGLQRDFVALPFHIDPAREHVRIRGPVVGNFEPLDRDVAKICNVDEPVIGSDSQSSAVDDWLLARRVG